MKPLAEQVLSQRIQEEEDLLKKALNNLSSAGLAIVKMESAPGGHLIHFRSKKGVSKVYVPT